MGELLFGLLASSFMLDMSLIFRGASDLRLEGWRERLSTDPHLAPTTASSPHATAGREITPSFSCAAISFQEVRIDLESGNLAEVDWEFGATQPWTDTRIADPDLSVQAVLRALSNKFVNSDQLLGNAPEQIAGLAATAPTQRVITSEERGIISVQTGPGAVGSLDEALLAAVAASKTQAHAHPGEAVVRPSNTPLADYGRLPLRFEANYGQVDSQVQFLARGPGYTLFLTAPEAVLVLDQPPSAQTGSGNPAAATPSGPASGLDTKGEAQSPAARTDVVRTQILGANEAARAVGRDRLEGKVNYFIGSDPRRWQTNVPTYAAVEYQEVYPGIDLVYYGNGGQLEYDFVIAPGADPGRVSLGLVGAEHVQLDEHGNLTLYLGDRQVRQHRPVVYQEVNGVRREVASSFVLREGQRVGFDVGAYDPGLPLVIDPVVSYSTYLGGSGIDRGWSIATDSWGHAYVTGRASSVDFPTANPFQPDLYGTDAFVTKLNPEGTDFVYSTYLGGSNEDDGGWAIAVDAEGNAFVTGKTDSPDFPTVGAFQAGYGGSVDGFIAKLNPEGSALIYSTFLGGSNEDYGHGITVDEAGSAYVTGLTNSADFPTANPLQLTSGGAADAFIAKLDPEGATLTWSTYLGGADADYGLDITIDPTGSVAIAGATSSRDFPTAGAWQTGYGGGITDAFVAKLDPKGSQLVFSTYLGGGILDYGHGIASDAKGTVYVTGYTSSRDFPTANALQPSLGGASDAFMVKLSADGSEPLYSTYLGGTREDPGWDVIVDVYGNAWVTGRTISRDFPLANPLQESHGGGLGDAYVAKLSDDGSKLLFSTYLGGSRNENGHGIATDLAGNVYVVGTTESLDFPTVNPLQPFHGGGGEDAMVLVITEGSAPAGRRHGPGR